MLKFATPQRLGVPSHCLNISSQRLKERLIKYKELYRNQREKKQSFPKKLFCRRLENLLLGGSHQCGYET